MPEHWDPDHYRERAKAWRDKATALPEDHPERSVCVELAEGYDKLATLLEQRRGGLTIQRIGADQDMADRCRSEALEPCPTHRVVE